MTRLWLLACDRCGVECQPHPSRAEVIREAERQGWHTRRGDICPDR